MIPDVNSPYTSCTLCPRRCKVNRLNSRSGRCGCDSDMRIPRISLHMWEEPCISGTTGAGTVFFAGCSLACVYCQNRSISHAAFPEKFKKYTPEELADAFLALQNAGAANINLVTPDHHMPKIDEALTLARKKGLILPIVCNCSGYQSAENLRKYYRQIDVFLTDFKYADSGLAKHLSGAADYPELAKQALDVMFEMVGEPVFKYDPAKGSEPLLTRGIIVRQLILPSHKNNSKEALKYLHETYGNKIYISIMNQYTPPAGLSEEYKEISRRLSRREYENVVDYALSLGIENAFIQEGDTAKESFIPDFDVSPF